MEYADVIDDIIWCHIAYGFQPDEFIMFKLCEKECEERKSYVSDTDAYSMYYQLNQVYGRSFFNNKYKTYLKFRPYYKREIISVESEKDFNSFSNFVARHESFVVKKTNLSKGDGVCFFNREKVY